MTRWMKALLLAALILASGFLVFYLLPVESDDPAPTPVTVSTTLTPEGTPTAFKPVEVRRAFRKHSLPLREFTSPLDEGVHFFELTGVPTVFRVDVYVSVEKAIAGQQITFVLSPTPDYRIRGTVETERKANVVVVYESGRPAIRQRLKAALASLQ